MSFGGDTSMSSSLQGATSKLGLSTLLGTDTTAGDAPPVNLATGKKPKGKSPTSSFLGADATPATGVGRSTLMGAG